MEKTNVSHDWTPLPNENLVEIPTERPLVRMEHKKTRAHAYFDVKAGRFLSQQEAHDALQGDCRLLYL